MGKKERNKQYFQRYKTELVPKMLKYKREVWRPKRRIMALQIVQAGGTLLWTGQEHPICVYCGCDDVRLLEINHKNGGGYYEKPKGSELFALIASGRRIVSDLEITCRVCNAKYYLELKYGQLPFIIIWNNLYKPQRDTIGHE